MNKRTVLFLLLAAGLGSVVRAQEPPELAAAEKAARQALEGFFQAFNAADNDALQRFCNYPHVFVGSNGGVRVIEDRWNASFDRMRQREGWHHSSLDSARAFLIKEDKVHYDLVFSRHRENGGVYRTVRGLWIMTKKDGRWGLSLRSY